MARPPRSPFQSRLAEFRRRAGMTQEQVGEYLGISAEMVRRHERGINLPIELYRKRYCQLFRATEVDLGFRAIALPTPRTDDMSLASSNGAVQSIRELVAQISDTGVSNEAIRQIERATMFLAESHTQAPARKSLSQVMSLHRRARSLLGEKLRLSQQRELYRIESLLLSHACLLFGDLDQNDLAERYGDAALAYAFEAETDQAIAMTALAKTYRWQDRLTESMEIARRGFECSPDTPIRIQLASQEANAAALMGDATRARQALARAEKVAETVAAGSGLSAWSFPIARQAVFAQSVATQIGDPDGMLYAASLADSAWSDGQPMVAANWAQIRVGAATAYLMRDSLDGALAEVEPVLALPPGMRVATVTAYTERLHRRLQNARYSGAAGVRELKERLAQFGAEALQDTESQEDSTS